MEFLTDALTRLGGYFYFVLIGAIEVIAAIVLIGILPARKKKEKNKPQLPEPLEVRVIQNLIDKLSVTDRTGSKMYWKLHYRCVIN